MKKTSALRIRTDPNLHHQFLEVCKTQDKPASQVLRDFMRHYVQMYGGGIQLDLFYETTGFMVVGK